MKDVTELLKIFYFWKKIDFSSSSARNSCGAKAESVIRTALAKAFLEWRAEKIIAKIVPCNQRSIRSVCACGFQESGKDGQILRYSITMDAYFQQIRTQAQKRA